jgi:hypothetical protein
VNRLDTALVAAATAAALGTSLAAQTPDVTVAQDLTSVIALQGQACGKVVSATEQSENDYVATCENGHRYRVLVNEDGRVIVEKLER